MPSRKILSACKFTCLVFKRGVTLFRELVIGPARGWSTLKRGVFGSKKLIVTQKRQNVNLLSPSFTKSKASEGSRRLE